MIQSYFFFVLFDEEPAVIDMHLHPLGFFEIKVLLCDGNHARVYLGNINNGIRISRRKILGHGPGSNTDKQHIFRVGFQKGRETKPICVNSKRSLSGAFTYMPPCAYSLFGFAHSALLDCILDDRDVLVKGILLEEQFLQWFESEPLQGE
jgi:hypothetical protein